MDSEHVYLDLTLQFKRGDAWGNVYDFDKDFAAFLKTLNLEGRVIEPIKGMPGRRFVYIDKIKEDILDNPNKNWKGANKKK